jgi:valyl-tRNA synthetase
MLPSFPEKAQQWAVIKDLISSIRSLRTQATIPPKEKLDIYVRTDEATHSLIDTCEEWIKKLAGISTIHKGEERPHQSLVATGKGWVLFLPVGAYLDIEKEIKRLSAEIQRVEKIISGLTQKIGDENFSKRAPLDVQELTKAQLENMSKQRQALKDNLDALHS